MPEISDDDLKFWQELLGLHLFRFNVWHDLKKALPPSLLQVFWHSALVLHRFVYFCCFSCSLRLLVMWHDVHRVCNFMMYTEIHVCQLRRSTINPAAQLNILDFPQRHKQKTTQTSQCHLCENSMNHEAVLCFRRPENSKHPGSLRCFGLQNGAIRDRKC